MPYMQIPTYYVAGLTQIIIKIILATPANAHITTYGAYSNN